MSNAPTHIIEGIIKNNINKLNHDDIKKQINNQLLPYIIIKNTDISEIPIFQTSNKEDSDEIIEYQTICSISISNIANKKINDNMEESNNTIIEKVYKFSINEQRYIVLNENIYKLINDTRYKIYNMSKKEWEYYEDLIEEVHKNLNTRNARIKENKKIGRAKKNNNTILNQRKIDTFLKELKEEGKGKIKRDGMDLYN